MAGFKVHLLGGMAVGGLLAGIGQLEGSITAEQAGAVAIMGTIGGLLPDLDSDTGKPLELLFQLLSILIPMLLYPYIRNIYGAQLTVMLLFFVISYLFVQYLFCNLIKKLTVHRGIMHSIPFAVLCGQITFLLFADAPRRVAIFCAVAVSLGAFIHLLLDELYSITFVGFIPRFNRASGSALAFYSSSFWATFTVYLLLLLTNCQIFYEKQLQRLCHEIWLITS